MADRVLVAKFAHESNTFAHDRTTIDDFRDTEEYRGEGIPAYFRGTSTEMAGAIETFENRDVDAVYTVAAQATPGGRVTAEAYDRYTGAIVGAVEDAEADGVLLVLHGAMVTENEHDAEGALVERVREVAGEVPIAVTLDLHGNVTDRMVATADALVACETHPHVDTFETGATGAGLLVDAVHGATMTTVAAYPPVLPHSPFQNTTREPMAGIQRRARTLEGRDGVRKVSVLPGFHRADVPGMGFSVPAVGREGPAREAARELAAAVWAERERFVGGYLTPEAAVGPPELAATSPGQHENERPRQQHLDPAFEICTRLSSGSERCRVNRTSDT